MKIKSVVIFPDSGMLFFKKLPFWLLPAIISHNFGKQHPLIRNSLFLLTFYPFLLPLLPFLPFFRKNTRIISYKFVYCSSKPVSVAGRYNGKSLAVFLWPRVSPKYNAAIWWRTLSSKSFTATLARIISRMKSNPTPKSFSAGSSVSTIVPSARRCRRRIPLNCSLLVSANSI